MLKHFLLISYPLGNALWSAVFAFVFAAIGDIMGLIMSGLCLASFIVSVIAYFVDGHSAFK